MVDCSADWRYKLRMSRQVIVKPQALDHLRWLPVRDQRTIVDGIRRHLVENDPAAESHNKFRLRRASRTADYELRLGDLRIFYRIDDAVSITVIGRKRGNTLVVQGKEYLL
jgi:mRNA-degrading endonuclease RelE of RelBE toxin-antitoxin system